jgi:DNA-binding beta-propeller fold protein YncE
MFGLFAIRRRVAVVCVLTAAPAVLALTGCGEPLPPPGEMPAALTPDSQAARAADIGDSPSARVAPDDGPIALNVPIGLAEDRHGNLFVANSGTSQILVYDSSNQQLTRETIHDGVNDPAGIAFDRKGNLYVANRNSHEVTVYDRSRKRIANMTLYTVKGNFSPSGVQVAPNGMIWVASRDDSDYNVGRVQIFDARGKLARTLDNHLEYPDGIAFRDGDAWVCDSTTPDGNALTVFDSAGTFVKTVSTPNFTPTYLAKDARGDLYVSDGLSAAIAEISGSGKIVKTITGKGLDLPYGIAFNRAGDFYVTNVGNNTITEYSSRGRLIHTIK